MKVEYRNVLNKCDSAREKSVGIPLSMYLVSYIAAYMHPHTTRAMQLYLILHIKVELGVCAIL